MSKLSDLINAEDSFLVKLRCENTFDETKYLEIKNQILIPENLCFQRPDLRQDSPAEPLTADRERNCLRAGTGVAIVKGDTIPIITMTALPPDKGVCLLPLCRGHAAEGTVRLALQRW